MAEKSLKVSPLLIFWVGVLTGALITGMVFLYQLYTGDMQANLFKSAIRSKTSITTTVSPTVTSAVTTTSPVSTKAIIDPTPW